MPAQTPAATPTQPGSQFPYMVTAASFVEAVNVPGYGTTNSIDNRRPQNEGLVASYGVAGLHLAKGSVAIIVPAANLKWVVLA